MWSKPIKGQRYSLNGEEMICLQVGLKYAMLADGHGSTVMALFSGIQDVTQTDYCINPPGADDMEQFYAAQRITQNALDSFRKKATYK